MVEQTDNQAEKTEEKPAKPQMSVADRVKRITIAAFFFILLTQIVAHRFPDLVLGKVANKTAEKTEEKTEGKNPSSGKINNEDKEVVTIAKDVAAQPDLHIPDSHNDERIKALEEKITQLEAANNSRASELEAKISAQNVMAQNKTESIVFALITFGQLKEAIKNGEGYKEPLSKLKEIMISNEQAQEIIATLAVNSETGVKNAAKLKEEFAPLIKQALTDKNENMFMRTLHKFITIRKIGEQKGDSDEEVLARAELKLSAGDIESALQEMDKISDKAKIIFADWIKEAGDILITRKNINKLELLLTQTGQAQNP